MHAAALMSSDVVTVSAEESLQKAVELMEEGRLRHLPVLQHEQLAGIISQCDLLEVTGWDPEGFFEQPQNRPKVVRDHMSFPVETASPGERVHDVAARLLDRGIGCLPIVDGESLVGVVTDTDILAAYVKVCSDGGVPAALDPPVSECMSEPVITIDGEVTVDKAVGICRSARFRHLPVLQEGWFVGVVSDRDLRRSLGRGHPYRMVSEVMSLEILSVEPNCRLSEAAALMVVHGVGSQTAVEERRLVGIVTTADVMQRCREIDGD